MRIHLQQLKYSINLQIAFMRKLSLSLNKEDRSGDTNTTLLSPVRAHAGWMAARGRWGGRGGGEEGRGGTIYPRFPTFFFLQIAALS